MRLAARLKRLRPDHALTGEGGASELPGAMRCPSPADSGASATCEAMLAESLGAACHEGLVYRDDSRPLPATACDLTALPETFSWSDARWVYLDTETTGLSGGVGNLAFMVGVARIGAQGALQVRQFVLGRFAAEPALLHAMLEWIGPDASLVSYNGRCFDVPLLQSRFRLHRIGSGLAELPHLDLMYTVRRAFRRHWPDCRLQTAERRLLGIERVDDLPGAEAPAAWQAWLCQRNCTPLKAVLTHNFQDVASLALLHRRLVAMYAGSGARAMDHATVGRAWIEAGDAQRARQVWERAATKLDETAGLKLAASYRRAGDWSTAESLWLGLFRRGSRAAACELSKLYEHRRHDLPRAVHFARCCVPAERETRLERLMAKLERDAQMALWHCESVGEGDEVGRAVGRG